MKKINFNQLKFHVIAIIIFFVISFSYFMKPLMEGEKISMSDQRNYMGVAKEILDHREKTGEYILWTNELFGGMPSYLVSSPKPTKFLQYIHNIFLLFNAKPVNYLFLYMLGFYIMLLCFNVNPWLSIAGSVAYCFSTYFFIIIEAGHVAKVIALGYMPPIIGGVYLAYNKRILLGSIIAGIFLSLQILVNHLQITYYTFIIILVFAIYQLWEDYKNKKLKRLLKVTAVLSIAALLAVLSNFTKIWTTYEYGKYSIRGKSELTTNKENQTSGLDKDYVTQWSYGKAETFTLLIPDFKGGSSHSKLSENSNTYEFLKQVQGKSAAKRYIKAMPTYWGDQPFTSGPVYVGAIICFLFVFGLFIIKGKIKWWLLIITILSILLSWGKNFPVLTNFFLDYFPGYNKFRSVTTILVIAEFAMPLLAILALNEISKRKIEKKQLLNYLKYSFGITGGLVLFILIISGMFSYEAISDQSYLQQGASQFVDALRADRLAMLRSDAFRSLVFISLAAGALWLYIENKLKFELFIGILFLLVLFDLWPVDKRYLNKDDFVTKREAKIPFPKSKADDFILQDRSPDYRVLNIAVNTFNDASTSYYHKSIGGYHGAKMRRYQELIEYQISPEIQALIQTLRNSPSYKSIDSTLNDLGVLNMLNTRYIIINPGQPPLYNKSALGNAWFVKEYSIVENADEEINTLYEIDPEKEAVINKEFSEDLTATNIKFDSTATISLTSYEPNNLIYESSSSADQLAVFSEIYYPKGWKVYIDDKPASHFRADYVLRAMIIPAGNHKIEFVFKPKSFYLGEKISFISSGVLILLLIGTLFVSIRKNKNEVKNEKEE